MDLKVPNPIRQTMFLDQSLRGKPAPAISNTGNGHSAMKSAKKASILQLDPTE